MKQLSPGEQPFTTSNAILAYCLHLAGVPWENNHQPVRVFYSREILNKFTNGSGDPFYKNWELEKAVEHAHKTGKRGHIEYVFKRTERIPALLKAFQEQVHELENGTGFLHELVDRVASQTQERDVKELRSACIHMKMRAQFMDIWKGQVPIVIIPNPGRVKHGTQMIDTKYGPREARVVETPGFRAVSLNASKKTREHLGLT